MNTQETVNSVVLPGLKKIPVDKQLHFWVGLSLGLTFGGFSLWLIPLVVIIGVSKEFWDKMSGTGTPEIADAAWTAVGSILAYVIVYLHLICE